jgi:hypothetical protein
MDNKLIMVQNKLDDENRSLEAQVRIAEASLEAHARSKGDLQTTHSEAALALALTPLLVSPTITRRRPRWQPHTGRPWPKCRLDMRRQSKLVTH